MFVRLILPGITQVFFVIYRYAPMNVKLSNAIHVLAYSKKYMILRFTNVQTVLIFFVVIVIYFFMRCCIPVRVA